VLVNTINFTESSRKAVLTVVIQFYHTTFVLLVAIIKVNKLLKSKLKPTLQQQTLNLEKLFLIKKPSKEGFFILRGPE
jgi:hypothetical protein